MEPLTQMETLLMGELMRVEEIAAKKTQVYADNAQDPELQRLLGSFADAHRQKIRGLISKLKTYGNVGEGQYA